MPPDDAAALPGDLLLQGVEGMERPLFVLDEELCFRYVNPAGARVLDRSVDYMLGRNIWTEFPEAVGGPFEELCTRVRVSGVSGSTESWFGPLGKWFRADAFLTDAGLVVTYDDVTERRHIEEERAAAVEAREKAAAEVARAAADAEMAGRHLMLLGEINLAMTSTFDTDEAVGRFAHLVVPLLTDWCLVSVVENGVRRDVGRAHRDPTMAESMHRYADLRVASNNASAPVPRLLRDPHPVVISEFTDEHLESMVAPSAREALAPLKPAAVAAFPLTARGETFGAFTLVNGPERGPHTEAELRTAEIASRRAALALDNARLAATPQRVAERLQLSLLSPRCSPTTWSWPSGTARPPRGCPSAVTGTTGSCSPTATRCWSSATSWATTSRRPPRWGRSRPSSGASPSTGWRSRPASCAASTTRSWASPCRPSPRRWCAAWSRPRPNARPACAGCAGPPAVIRSRCSSTPAAPSST